MKNRSGHISVGTPLGFFSKILLMVMAKKKMSFTVDSISIEVIYFVHFAQQNSSLRPT